MSTEAMELYVEAVCGQIRNKRVHPDVREELFAHLEDAVIGNMERGMSEEEAIRQAVAGMGDPLSVGKDLNRTHKVKIEWTVIALTAFFMAVGLLAMLSIVVSGSWLNDALFVNKLKAQLAGVFVLAGVALFDYRKLLRYTWHLYAGAILLIVMTAWSSGTVNGVPHLELPFNSMRIDVSFFAAVLLLIAVSGQIAGTRVKDTVFPASGESSKGSRDGISGSEPLMRIQIPRFAKEWALYADGLLWKLLWFVVIPFMGLFQIRSFSALFVYATGLILLLVCSRMKERFALIGLTAACCTVGLAAGGSYGLQRLKAFFGNDPDASFYTKKSLFLIEQGGLWGQGFAHGVKGIPAVHAELIFPYLVYALGWAAGAIVVAAAVMLALRFLQAAGRTTDSFGKMLAAVVIAYFSIHFFWNFLMAIGLLPIIGLGLPFISYGGSSSITEALLMGLFLSVYRLGRKPAANDPAFGRTEA
ncbi:FtsW/RodA/SpoVE family cell cycle protein [Paenibacillus sp. MBLB4367]|uniref:FtsW/RodA/SpoVE family cell cycle protein n=1 Tax=Paenibacillus sp. MBLB4367 TaxID=3384767 RepID=UPI003908342F